jgi:hypothetical protein
MSVLPPRATRGAITLDRSLRGCPENPEDELLRDLVKKVDSHRRYEQQRARTDRMVFHADPELGPAADSLVGLVLAVRHLVVRPASRQ